MHRWAQAQMFRSLAFYQHEEQARLGTPSINAGKREPAAAS
jgi:hypothetical protein